MGRAPSRQDIAATLPETGRGLWKDPEYAGLEMRGNKNGGTWCLRRRVEGKRIRDTLGRWPDLTTSGARKAASALVEATSLKVAAGGDPLADRQAKIDAKAKRRAALTLGAGLSKYAEGRLSVLRTGKQAEGVLRSVFADLMSRSLADISKRDLINCVDRRRATAPGVAEQSLRYAKPFFRWMYERGLSENLLHDVRAAQTNKRDRTLSMVELGRVLLALDEMGDEAPALCIRTLIATAGRLNEVAGMRASEIDGDLWTLPGERNKSKRVHLVPLNAEAQAAISRGYDRGLVFPGKRGVFNGWSRFKNRLNAACGVSDWVFHDMRRSFASVCADKGVDPIVADRCLNHAASGTQSIVMRIYQRSEMLEQRRAALNIWSDALAEARAVAHGQRVGELTT